MTARRPSYAVNADPSRLAADWFRDPLVADEVYARVRALTRDGASQNEVARRTGVSSRGVGRILKRCPL